MFFISGSKTQNALVLLFLAFLGTAIFRGAMSWLMDYLPITAELDKMLVYKSTFALILVALIAYYRYFQQCGFNSQVNWKTLPLYWPFAVILILILMGAKALPEFSVLVKIAFMALAVAFVEETLFRGLVVHWFRHLSPRKIVLISGLSFGSMHLFGLLSDFPATVIFSQVYFAGGLGVIFAFARIRDHSIWLVIFVHWLFDFVAIGSKGGITETFGNSEEAVMGLLFAGTIAWIWSLYLIKKAGNKEFAEISH